MRIGLVVSGGVDRSRCLVVDLLLERAPVGVRVLDPRRIRRLPRHQSAVRPGELTQDFGDLDQAG